MDRFTGGCLCGSVRLERVGRWHVGQSGVSILDAKDATHVEQLRQSGFQEIGCWELDSARDLSHSIDLPRKAGVYAFAIDGVVQYVGLASKSLHQRLNFYRKPGASQRTNIRLNEIIRGRLEGGAMVQILVGHPPDHQWKGFRISGAEGLEAGLISAFDLPWNMRGANSSALPAPTSRRAKDSKGGGMSRVIDVIRARPGLTELEIARAVYGKGAVQQQVNQVCRLLVKQGLVERRGAGGRADPYVYYPGAAAE